MSRRYACGLSSNHATAQTIDPTILYFGTPVALISTCNPDGSHNLAPMSSAWWLGWTCMLGLGQMSQTAENLTHTGECVINLPDASLVAAIDRLALTTGRDPVPERKAAWGDRHVRDKFGQAGLSRVPSETVTPPRAAECPVQMEGLVRHHRPFGKNVSATVFEVEITRLHLREDLLEGDRHIDPTKWSPLIMSFCRFFSLGGEVHPSRLDDSEFLRQFRRAS